MVDKMCRVDLAKYHTKLVANLWPRASGWLDQERHVLRLKKIDIADICSFDRSSKIIKQGTHAATKEKDPNFLFCVGDDGIVQNQSIVSVFFNLTQTHGQKELSWHRQQDIDSEHNDTARDQNSEKQTE